MTLRLIGTSCAFSVRFCEVTVMVSSDGVASSASCAIEAPANAMLPNAT